MSLRLSSEEIESQLHRQIKELTADLIELAEWCYPPPDGIMSHAALKARQVLKKYCKEAE